jgi:hypothetical protein
MSVLDKGRRITLTFREKGPSGRPTLVVDVSADSDILPHEHRDDMRTIAAKVMGVPLSTLEGVEVELRKTGGDHEHPHPHPHEEKPVAPALPQPVAEPPKAKA